MIIIIITISLLLLCAAGYIIYWQRNKTTLYRKQAEIDKMRIEHLHLSMELEEKKQVLQTAMAEQNHKAEELQAEIDIISTRYQQLQQQRLESSIIGKELPPLLKKNKLEDHQNHFQ
ncbi:hypothetical protein [Phocaeicola sartorii]|uniref:hypothetical protein n=1 Tax=Phocaeicola sartorii TaxID=671267 RepID=UPI003F69111E